MAGSIGGTSEKPLKFLDFSPEIRNKIYEFLCDGVVPPSCFSASCERCTSKNKGVTSLLPFVLSCKQIRAEFPLSYFTRNTFVVKIEDLDSLVKQLGCEEIALLKYLHVDMATLKWWNGPRNDWDQVVDVVPLIKLLDQYPILVSKIKDENWIVGSRTLDLSKFCRNFWDVVQNQVLHKHVRSGYVSKVILAIQNREISNEVTSRLFWHNVETLRVFVDVEAEGSMNIATIAKWMNEISRSGVEKSQMKSISDFPKRGQWWTYRYDGCGPGAVST
ncbi:hypothetical protein EJ08DRAFT_169011 [Tothia fuscella]|uniref:F-box domain-containing protein n=1 Tax=Tothia fuscella TaxID=1048955 RepID=A0A9P4NVD3_9PEZI|nr:hypothetical protein EJ08DRAFT_169011 [Tothia fuscella]